jgi:WD40 repeat protein
LWDFETRKLIATLEGHGEWVSQVAFSPDGKTLASASFDHQVKLWDVETKKNTMTLSGHEGFVASVAFSPDGQRLASGGWDYQIKLWDLRPTDYLPSDDYTKRPSAPAKGDSIGNFEIWIYVAVAGGFVVTLLLVVIVLRRKFKGR